jgi:hypothetical protein
MAMNEDESMEFEKRRKFFEKVDETYEPVRRLPWVILAGLTFAGFLWMWGVFTHNELMGLSASRNQFIPLTKVDAMSKEGLVEVPLYVVLEKKMVSFEFNFNENRIPLLAYTTPKGKIVTAIGLSRPCNSQDFHIEGKDLVCDVCHTRWDLESLEGKDGECQGQSLETIPHFLHKGKLIIKETDVGTNRPQMAGVKV